MTRAAVARQDNGVSIVEQPVEKPHGTVAIVADLYGNKFDLIGRKAAQ